MARLPFHEIVTPALLQRFQQEAELEQGDGRHYGLVLREDGEFFAHHPASPALDPQQLMWAADVLKLLNRELHHDGAWVVGFTHPRPADGLVAIQSPAHWFYRRYALMWMDRDGDVQFTIEWVENDSELLDWADVLLQGLEAVGHKAEAAWTIWHTHMVEVIEPRAGETFKRAKGERAPSERH